jgi:hypothetical protein
MSINLVLFLVFWSAFFLVFTYKKIINSKVKLFDLVWWLFFATFMIILVIVNALFGDFLSKIITSFFSSTVNAVFTIFIGFSILIIFLQNLKVSKLNEQVEGLSHKISLLEYSVRKDK